MPQVATGVLACVADRLAILVADCATFRTVVGAANRTEALAKIHIPLALDDGSHPMPRAIINPESGSLNRQKTGIGFFEINGRLPLSLEFEIPSSILTGVLEKDIERESEVWMANQCGLIMEEMGVLAGTGVGAPGETHLNVIDFEDVDGPVAYAEEEIPQDSPGQNLFQWLFTVMVQFQ